MATIVIHLADEQAKRLAELACRHNMTLEDLAAAKLRDVLDEPDEEFQRILSRVLEKNAELYRRLA